ncbi:MAG: hypothetical protein ABEK12_02925, partial [Candidatus Nanohaloarchaea archaeon]
AGPVDVTYREPLPDDVAEGHVIVVEDMVDVGKTAAGLMPDLRDQSNADTVQFVSLFDKPANREPDIEPDLTGIVVPGEFLIGVGLDVALDGIEIGRGLRHAVAVDTDTV